MNKKINKKAILKSLAFSSLVAISFSSLAIDSNLTINEKSNDFKKETNTTSRANPVSLKTQYVYQDNFFLPMISKDAIGISFDSTMKIISASTPNGFLNWEANLNDHPSIKGLTSSTTWSVKNGIVYEETSGNEFYAFLAVEDTTDVSNINYRILFYDVYGTPLIYDETNLNKTYTMTNDGVNNPDKKVVFAYDKVSKMVYIFNPGTIESFKRNVKSFLLFDGFWYPNELEASLRDWAPYNLLKNENIILGIVISPYNARGPVDRIQLIINHIDKTSGQNWIIAAPFARRNFAISPGTFSYNITTDDTNSVAKWYDTNATNTGGPGAPVNINFHSNNRSSLFEKISPVSFYSTSSNNPRFEHNFLFTLPTNNINESISIKFFAGSEWREEDQVDISGRGSAFLQEGHPDIKTNFKRAIVSPYDGNVHLSLYESNDATNKGYWIEKNNLDFWSSQVENPLNIVQSQRILDDGINKGINLSSAFIRRASTATNLLSIYTETRNVINSFSVPNINLTSFPSTFDPAFDIRSIPNSFNYFQNENNFQKRAKDLGWEVGGTSPMLPSDVIKNITVGNNFNDNFFIGARSLTSLGFPSNPTFTTSNVVSSNPSGTFEGDFQIQLPNTFALDRQIDLFYKVKLSNLPATAGGTEIQVNQDAITNSNFIPSDINNTNLLSFVNILNLPPSTNISSAIVSYDNLVGNVNATITVDKWFNSTGTLVSDPRVFNVALKGFKTITPTNVIQDETFEPSFYTTHDINDSILNQMVVFESLPNGSNTKIEIESSKPTEGILNLKVTINQYYNNLGKPVDSENDVPASTPFVKNLEITGFKKVTETKFIEKEDANKSVYVYDVTKDSFFDYVEIVNRVPDSEVVVNTITYVDGAASPTTTPSVKFNFTVSQIYNNLGQIVSGRAQDIEISGFIRGDNRNATRIRRRSFDVSTLYPWQVNERNVEQFVEIVRLPTESKAPIYKFSLERNIGTNLEDGSLTITAEVDRRYEVGTEQVIPGIASFTIRVNGFRSVTGGTQVRLNRSAPNKVNQYASNVTSENYKDYITVINTTGISDTVTDTVVNQSDISYDNNKGTIDIRYKLVNFFDGSDGGAFVRMSDFQRTITIPNFRIVDGRTELSLKPDSEIIFSSILPSNFQLNIDNYTQFFNERLKNEVTDIVGGTSLTTLSDIKLESHDDAKGEVTLKIKVVGSYFDDNLLPTSTGANFFEITQVITGFDKVEPVDNSLFIIIGAGVGGLLLIAIIITLIILANKSKKKKAHEQSRKDKMGQTKGPSGPTPTRPIPMGPGMNQTASRPTAQVPIGTARPMPPTQPPRNPMGPPKTPIK